MTLSTFKYFLKKEEIKAACNLSKLRRFNLQSLYDERNSKNFELLLPNPVKRTVNTGWKFTFQRYANDSVALKSNSELLAMKQ